MGVLSKIRARMGCTTATHHITPRCLLDDTLPSEPQLPSTDQGLPAGFELHKDHDQEKVSFHQRYVLLGILGNGSFAKVYAGEEVSACGRVAVKVIYSRPKLTDSDSAAAEDKFRSTVENEVMIARRVAHLRCCVQLISFFQEDTFAYIIMEECQSSLVDCLDRMDDLNERTLAPVFHSMFSALKSVHLLGVVHRDVKPDNFLCAGMDTSCVKLADFGLAALQGPVAGGAGSRLRGVHGTAPFMSPEMLKAEGYDTKTDVWSMGVIMYVIMLGQFPYMPPEATPKAMKAAILTGHPEPSYQTRPITAASL
jgi:serine/threonine protein kinase